VEQSRTVVDSMAEAVDFTVAAGAGNRIRRM
jgi:hypothetical protein